MRSTITERGQTVIPAAIRRLFQLTPSEKLEWVVDGNTIRVVPVRADPVAAFRGSGRGNSTARLLAERQQDRRRESAPGTSVKAPR
jgi:AbrB family looped-hinge helix DNA binding protein